MKRTWKNYLFVITISFFTLGMFNILFALMGFVCLILPFVLLYKNKKKTWCQQYCPRSNLFSVLFKGRSLTNKLGPDWITRGKGKWFFLVYFTVNIFIIFMSTIMVLKGKREPMELIRFMIVFPIPWHLPQIINIGEVSDWVIHLSYRIYSMIFTTTVIGLVLAGLFLPRTWCRVCPINTLSDLGLQRMKEG